jgi:hypothetical protein
MMLNGTIKHRMQCTTLCTLPYKNQFAAAEHQQIPHIHVIMMATNCCKKAE